MAGGPQPITAWQADFPGLDSAGQLVVAAAGRAFGEGVL